MHCKSILLVEDDADIRETFRDTLEMEGYPVQIAANGQEALTLLAGEDEKPALILLDLMMPVMNGWEFLEIKAQDKVLAEIPVVVVSAVVDLHKNRPLGAIELIRKPTDIHCLINTVKRFCEVPLADGFG